MNDKPGNGSIGLRGVVRQLSLRRGRNASQDAPSPKQAPRIVSRDKSTTTTTGNSGGLARSFSASSSTTSIERSVPDDDRIADALAFQPKLRAQPRRGSRSRRVESVWGPPPASQESGAMNMFGVDLEPQASRKGSSTLEQPIARTKNPFAEVFDPLPPSAAPLGLHGRPKLNARYSSSSGFPGRPSSRERIFGGLFGSVSTASKKKPSIYGEPARRSFDSICTSTAESLDEPIMPKGSVNVRRSSTLRTDRDMGHFKSRSEQRAVSSTTRAKPSLDLTRSPPLPSSPFNGYWAPPKLDDDVEELSSMTLSSPILASNDDLELAGEAKGDGEGEWALMQNVKDHMRAKRELMGHGPFWAVQRGWKKGVFSSHAEADRQIRDFPGPLMRKFDDFDEATAFVKATQPVIRPRTPDEDESTGRRFIGPLSRNSSLRRPNAAQGDNGIPRTFSPPSGLKTLPANASIAKNVKSNNNPFWSDGNHIPSPASRGANSLSKPTTSTPLTLAPTRAMTLMAVSDLESSLSFYRQVLGFVQVGDSSVQGQVVVAPSNSSSVCIALRSLRNLKYPPQTLGSNSFSSSVPQTPPSTKFQSPSQRSKQPPPPVPPLPSSFEPRLTSSSSSEDLSSQTSFNSTSTPIECRKRSGTSTSHDSTFFSSDIKTPPTASCVLLECEQDMQALRRGLLSRLADPTLAIKWPRAFVSEATSDEEIFLIDPDGHVIVLSPSPSFSSSSKEPHRG